MFRNITIASAALIADTKLQEMSGHFKNFIRISSEDFEFLINMMIIGKVNTIRKSVPIKERLAVTLRFLAIGDSYSSLLPMLLKFRNNLLVELYQKSVRQGIS
ncbi:hypothetical protein NQ318_003382 [Aromia moschata]|uniref:Uncharacterized protein n=1 Tax=Aromia moschata TaxID=1265417 RepID=A0AAV8YAI7_9CUCU|nr:hypothetical protein NQ318_003382 [Aromia moschata]